MSLKIKDELIERAKDFQIILDDVAITDTGFSPRFTQVNIPDLGSMDRQGSMDCQGFGQGDNFLFSLLNKNKLLNSKHFKPNTLFKKLNRPNKKRLLLPREMLKGNFSTNDLCWPQMTRYWLYTISVHVWLVNHWKKIQLIWNCKELNMVNRFQSTLRKEETKLCCHPIIYYWIFKLHTHSTIRSNNKNHNCP